MTPLARIAFIADTHMTARDGESGSPWASNALANARARWLVARLNAEAPDLVVHLGDMVHPIPAQPDYAAAAERFHAVFADLRATLRVLPGNHDLGDKPVDWMPAHPVDRASIAAYRHCFGPLWEAVDVGPVRLLLHCSQLLGSGLAEEAEQEAWLEACLQTADRTGRRVVFCTHYPLFLTDPDEPEHYDNLGAGRAGLLAMLRNFPVETVLAAHVHAVFHTGLGASGAAPLQHVVPAISAVRHDYSHRSPAPPPAGAEFGRNEGGQLGYYMMDVFATGHRLRLRRTGGATGGDVAPPAIYRGMLAARPLGVDLRHDWAGTVAIPYSGVVDEFRRKHVRNDDTVAALQEAGLRDLRFPADDLLRPDCRRRLAELAALGHRAHPFTIDPPTDAAVAMLRAVGPALVRLEVVARRKALAGRVQAWRRALGGAHVPVFAAPIASSAQDPDPGAQFTHRIVSGVAPQDPHDDFGADGIVFRIPPGVDPAQALVHAPRNPEMVVYLSTTHENPAKEQRNDALAAARLKGALTALPAGAILMLDTLFDADRGYFPRHGLFDARLAPREAARFLAGWDPPGAHQGRPAHGAC